MMTPEAIKKIKATMPLIHSLNSEIEKIVDEFDPDKATDDERSQMHHLQGLLKNPFFEAARRLEFMFAEVIAEGRLVKNCWGRFEIEGTEICFSSGSSCEAYLPYFPNEQEPMAWLPTGIEHSSEYYFTARPNVTMEGVLVRIRACSRW